MSRGKSSARGPTRIGARWAVLVAVFFLVAPALVPGAYAGARIKASEELYGAAKAGEFVPRELVVWFAEDVGRADADAAIARTGGEVVRRSSVTPSRVVISVPEGAEDSLLKAYRARKEVRAADKNHILHALWIPNDTYYKRQWHFNKPDFIYAEQGWDVERGEPKVVVAIVDTGAAYEDRPVPSSEQEEVVGSSYHRAPDLAGTSFVPGYDFVHNDEHPNDQNGHGTHVAGTVAQTTNNAADVAGLAHKCSIMPVQVLNYKGAGTSSAVADGIDFARKKGAQVINMSLGGPNKDYILETSCGDAEKAGVVVVAASGNDGASTVYYPAGFDSVIAVGAVDYAGELSWYSNYGSGQELVAPGGDTLADENGDGYPDGVLQMTYNQIYEPGSLPWLPGKLANVTTFTNYYLQGTSMACPHVAALAALVIANGVTDNAEVRKVLRGSATDLGTSGYDTKYGYGLINCEAALKGKVRETDDECGECAQLSLAEFAVFFGLLFGAYGFIFARRKLKR